MDSGRPADALRELEQEFWGWRSVTAPDTSDDLPRLHRPPGWAPDWSAAAIQSRRAAAGRFLRRHQGLDVSDQPVGVQVDARLLRCALARVTWELELTRGWQTNPGFYLDQSLGALFTVLLAPPPFDEERTAAIGQRLAAVPEILAQARENLADELAAPFAADAGRHLAHAPADLTEAMTALAPLLPAARRSILENATTAAAAALVGYRDWLAAARPGARPDTAVGAAAFGYFLHDVALLPYPAAEIAAMGRQEWQRAAATEAILAARCHHRPAPPLPADTDTQVAQELRDEQAVRDFYVERAILSQAPTLRHYRFAPMPAYLRPLSWLGVTDDLGSPATAGADAVRYVPPPAPDLAYFAHAAAVDPRLAIIHEGVHAQQLALSWAHPVPARRHYYDSAPNEGIAFYNEELMLLCGLFDDYPHSARVVANFLRLRALRVEVDVALAVGELNIDEATARLAAAVPMDEATAREEAVFFAANPGQAMSYLVGKHQILALLAAAATRDGFTLTGFHDRLWREGNVPLVLQRWELLGLRDHLDRADELAELGRTARMAAG